MDKKIQSKTQPVKQGRRDANSGYRIPTRGVKNPLKAKMLKAAQKKAKPEN